jgi:hypothetical protein
VQEYYFYVDSTPTHSCMKYLYKYPHREYPYRDLVETNRRRSRKEMEYELLDTVGNSAVATVPDSTARRNGALRYSADPERPDPWPNPSPSTAPRAARSGRCAHCCRTLHRTAE